MLPVPSLEIDVIPEQDLDHFLAMSIFDWNFHSDLNY